MKYKFRLLTYALEAHLIRNRFPNFYADSVFAVNNTVTYSVTRNGGVFVGYVVTGGDVGGLFLLAPNVDISNVRSVVDKVNEFMLTHPKSVTVYTLADNSLTLRNDYFVCSPDRPSISKVRAAIHDTLEGGTIPGTLSDFRVPHSHTTAFCYMFEIDWNRI